MNNKNKTKKWVIFQNRTNFKGDPRPMFYRVLYDYCKQSVRCHDLHTSLSVTFVNNGRNKDILFIYLFIQVRVYRQDLLMNCVIEV